MLLLTVSGEGCIDGRKTSFAISAVAVLNASGPQGLAISQSPILVTYGPAMTNTPRFPDGFGLGEWGYNIIVHVKTEAKPPARNVLYIQPETV